MYAMNTAEPDVEEALRAELSTMKRRYEKLEGLMQRLVGLVQRDSPATLLEFMERGEQRRPFEGKERGEQQHGAARERTNVSGRTACNR